MQYSMGARKTACTSGAVRHAPVLDGYAARSAARGSERMLTPKREPLAARSNASMQ